MPQGLTEEKGEDQKITETKIIKYLTDNWRKHFPGRYDIHFEQAIYGCISGEKIGFADITIKIGKTTHIGEIKYESFKSKSFWESLKVIGYCCSMNLFSFKKNKIQHSYQPFIMIPKEHLSYDFEVILYTLKCGYISFVFEKDKIKFQENLYKRRLI